MSSAKEVGFSCSAWPIGASCDTIPEDTVFLVAIGGDGTILKTVPIASAYNIPILGINLGRVGFLSEVLPEDFPQALRAYQEQALLVEERMMLSCYLNGRETCTSLNEILLYKQSFSGVAYINIEVDGVDAGSVFCDGIIVGTPTGATGYSISAGGPILAPGLDACVITPVCSHSLLVRPIVASGNSKIVLRMLGPGALYADGQSIVDVGEDDHVLVMRTQRRVKFLRLRQHNVYGLIKEKLG